MRVGSGRLYSVAKLMTGLFGFASSIMVLGFPLVSSGGLNIEAKGMDQKQVVRRQRIMRLNLTFES